MSATSKSETPLRQHRFSPESSRDRDPSDEDGVIEHQEGQWRQGQEVALLVHLEANQEEGARRVKQRQ